MNRVEELRRWQSEEFLPWQRAIEAFNDEAQQQVARLRRHASELKTMVALILDDKPDDAAALWNRLEFQPRLKSIEVLENDVLILTLPSGREQHVALDDLLADLSALLR